MCSIGDDGVDGDVPVKFMEPKPLITDKLCNKCKTNSAVVLLRSKDCYCKECFLNGTIHKFKSFLGKLRLSRVVERVLVSYKTGHSSAALVQFLRLGLDGPPQKQLKFSPVFIYVEQNYHLPLEERKEVLQRISDHLKKFNFKLYFVSFGEYVTTGQFTIEETWSELKLHEDSEELHKRFREKTKLTYKKEIFNIYERELLIKCAKLLECSFIFTTDLTADVAVKLLTNISLGRGNQLPLDVGVVDDRDQVKIIKPMRYLNVKECAIFNYFNNIEPVVIKGTIEKPYSSVQSLMADFITKLQVDYPATVTTVLRTGDKLSMDRYDLPKCELCKAPIFGSSNKLISSEATNFSRYLSTTKLDMKVQPTKRCEDAISSYTDTTDQQYCYSCKIVSEHIVK